jgi:hypothetical protein
MNTIVTLTDAVICSTTTGEVVELLSNELFEFVIFSKTDIVVYCPKRKAYIKLPNTILEILTEHLSN